jgi:hypothetical protein
MNHVDSSLRSSSGQRVVPRLRYTPQVSAVRAAEVEKICRSELDAHPKLAALSARRHWRPIFTVLSTSSPGGREIVNWEAIKQQRCNHSAIPSVRLAEPSSSSRPSFTMNFACRSGSARVCSST